MIDLVVKELDGEWFGLAHAGEQIVATVHSSSKSGAWRSLRGALPAGIERREREEGSRFAERTILMLRDLHAGKEDSKSFTLASGILPERVLRVLRAAASIPIGYVASYGGIAKAAGAIPRHVGRIMATNPLYPIVPCHRVVGSNFSLVGYGGKTDRHALQAKLGRLRAEARGFETRSEFPVDGGSLTIHPVEEVLRRAEKDGLAPSRQKSLFGNQDANDPKQAGAGTTSSREAAPPRPR